MDAGGANRSHHVARPRGHPRRGVWSVLPGGHPFELDAAAALGAVPRRARADFLFQQDDWRFRLATSVRARAEGARQRLPRVPDAPGQPSRRLHHDAAVDVEGGALEVPGGVVRGGGRRRPAVLLQPGDERDHLGAPLGDAAGQILRETRGGRLAPGRRLHQEVAPAHPGEGAGRRDVGGHPDRGRQRGAGNDHARPKGRRRDPARRQVAPGLHELR
mmetsp:Transcript_103053/g.291903  ORF Transcript_103053/g.291903 Transcript_103053/m.291903 type:complete len:217 (-) Transcript_103053:848-1498(-)